MPQPGDPPDHTITQNKHAITQHNILRTSGQIREESFDLFYHHNIFTINIDMERVSKYLHDWFISIGAPGNQTLRSFKFHISRQRDEYCIWALIRTVRRIQACLPRQATATYYIMNSSLAGVMDLYALSHLFRLRNGDELPKLVLRSKGGVDVETVSGESENLLDTLLAFTRRENPSSELVFRAGVSWVHVREDGTEEEL